MENNQKESTDRTKIGGYAPEDVTEINRIDSEVFSDWPTISGLSSTVSDVLDELGYATSIPGGYLGTNLEGSRIVGQAITLRYLPERKPGVQSVGRLGHKQAFKHAKSGEVLVIEGDRFGRYSVLGGLAAAAGKKVGLAGVVADGAVRDLDEIYGIGLPVWSSSVTPMTGRGRLECVGINVPVCIHNIQVTPGDIVVADDSGICFVPLEVANVVSLRIKEIWESETKHVEGK